MTSLAWFRLYAEFATDPVVQSLAFEDQRHFVILMCFKCNGLLDRNISKSMKEKIILRGLGLDPVTGSEVKRRLIDAGLIDNFWQPNAWNKRQYKSDKSTERVNKYRKNKEPCNVSETLLKQECNGPETDTDPEADTETETENRSFRSSLRSDRGLMAHEGKADVDFLFGPALRWLIDKSIPEKAARKLIGKLRKLKGDEQACRVLIYAQENDISDPGAYLMAATTAKSDPVDDWLKGEGNVFEGEKSDA